MRPQSSDSSRFATKSWIKTRESPMVSKRVTFAQLDAVLGELDFKKAVISESHVNYRHASSEKPIMLRLHKPGDYVPDFELAYVRHELEWLGIIDSADFEEKVLAAAP